MNLHLLELVEMYNSLQAKLMEHYLIPPHSPPRPPLTM
jgi:hypothetical protein